MLIFLYFTPNVIDSSRGMDYMLLIYGKQAQEYIVQNLEKILCGEVAK